MFRKKVAVSPQQKTAVREYVYRYVEPVISLKLLSGLVKTSGAFSAFGNANFLQSILALAVDIQIYDLFSFIRFCFIWTVCIAYGIMLSYTMLIRYTTSEMERLATLGVSVKPDNVFISFFKSFFNAGVSVAGIRVMAILGCVFFLYPYLESYEMRRENYVATANSIESNINKIVETQQQKTTALAKAIAGSQEDKYYKNGVIPLLSALQKSDSLFYNSINLDSTANQIKEMREKGSELSVLSTFKEIAFRFNLDYVFMALVFIAMIPVTGDGSFYVFIIYQARVNFYQRSKTETSTELEDNHTDFGLGGDVKGNVLKMPVEKAVDKIKWNDPLVARAADFILEFPGYSLRDYENHSEKYLGVKKSHVYFQPIRKALERQHPDLFEAV